MLGQNADLTQALKTDSWEQRKLGELYAKAGSGGTPPSKNRSYYNGDIPFLGISDMDGRYIVATEKSLTEDGLAHSAAWIVPTGSIALAMYASVGKVGITSCDMATSQAFFNMVFDSDAARDFVYARLDKADSEGEWRSLISTGTQSNLNARKVRSWMISAPSLSEQRAIGAFFADLDNLITLRQRELSTLNSKPCPHYPDDYAIEKRFRWQNRAIRVRLTPPLKPIFPFEQVVYQVKHQVATLSTWRRLLLARNPARYSCETGIGGALH